MLGAQAIASADGDKSEKESKLINNMSQTLKKMSSEREACLQRNEEKSHFTNNELVLAAVPGSLGCLALGYFSTDFLHYKKNKETERNIKEEVKLWSSVIESEQLENSTSSQIE